MLRGLQCRRSLRRHSCHTKLCRSFLLLLSLLLLFRLPSPRLLLPLLHIQHRLLLLVRIMCWQLPCRAGGGVVWRQHLTADCSHT
jgi:hypothetical protein